MLDHVRRADVPQHQRPHHGRHRRQQLQEPHGAEAHGRAQLQQHRHAHRGERGGRGQKESQRVHRDRRFRSDLIELYTFEVNFWQDVAVTSRNFSMYEHKCTSTTEITDILYALSNNERLLSPQHFPADN